MYRKVILLYMKFFDACKGVNSRYPCSENLKYGVILSLCYVVLTLKLYEYVDYVHCYKTIQYLLVYFFDFRMNIIKDSTCCP